MILVVVALALVVLVFVVLVHKGEKQIQRDIADCVRLNREQDEQLSAYFRGERKHPPSGVHWQMRW